MMIDDREMDGNIGSRANVHCAICAILTILNYHHLGDFPAPSGWSLEVDQYESPCSENRTVKRWLVTLHARFIVNFFSPPLITPSRVHSVRRLDVGSFRTVKLVSNVSSPRDNCNTSCYCPLKILKSFLLTG